MSDNNVCPLCGKIMRIQLGTFYENDFCNCEGKKYTWTLPSVEDLQSEIARLKAELEKAEMEREALRSALHKESESVDDFATLLFERTIERDEARKWARYFYDMWNAAENSSLHNLRE